MNIKLSNGTELAPILVTGANRHIQGAARDTLTFIFPATESMEALDAAFSEEACSSIIIDEGNVYKGYTIRAELKKEAVEVTPATEETEAVMEDRIFVSMSQRTYLETQLKNLTETVDALVLESLMNETEVEEDV